MYNQLEVKKILGDDDLITSTVHDVYLEVYGTGASDYTVTWSKSGEYSNLLDLDIYVDDGEIFKY